jgi:SAM-dependent methyltransferase
MSNMPTKQNFIDAYASEAPWDIGRPQQSFVDAADRVTGNVLDCGCGTGDASLYFAERGLNVTGIDYLDEPIQRAKRKAAERKSNASFFLQDATALDTLPGFAAGKFDTALDSGLFHTFSDTERPRYVGGLKSALKPGGRLLLMCFSEAEPGEFGPRRITKADLESSFADGWTIESISPATFALNPNFKGPPFSPGGPKSWFMIAKRV